ncbi:hypothetical protein DHD32_16580 [Arenibacter sp. TNZ]|nr:hypothetical protein [Arenibacter sp. TNZ]
MGKGKSLEEGQNTSSFIGLISKVVCELEKDILNNPRVRVMFIFCIAQKTARAEKPRYSVHWLRGASYSQAISLISCLCPM